MSLKLVDLDQIPKGSLFLFAIDLQLELEPVQCLGIKLVLGCEVVEVVDSFFGTLLSVVSLGLLRLVRRFLGRNPLLHWYGIAKHFGSQCSLFIGG